MNNQITKHKIDLDTISYQIALDFVNIIENTIKPKLEKNILSDYDIEAVTEIFNNCLTVNKDSDLKKYDLSKLDLKYCFICGNESYPLEKRENKYFCVNECVKK